MLCWEEFVELRNLHERGWSISAIARHLGKDRKTVRRYLADPDARPGVRKPTGKLIDPYVAYVQARLEDNPHEDDTVAAAILDRLLGNAVVINIRGESYRMRTHRRLLEETRKGVITKP